jgi:hypothetical protein
VQEGETPNQAIGELFKVPPVGFGATHALINERNIHIQEQINDVAENIGAPAAFSVAEREVSSLESPSDKET